MDNFKPASIILLWKQEYSSHLTKYTKHEAKQPFHHIAEMCALGLSYYYILNFIDLSLEYIHPNVKHIIGLKPNEIAIEILLKQALPEKLQLIERSGQRLGIWVAHGEGKFYLPQEESDYNFTMRYSYKAYPGNPNGSIQGTTGIASADCRHLVIMPHIERNPKPWNWPHCPANLQDDFTP